MNYRTFFQKKRYVLLKNFFDPKNLLEETNNIIKQSKTKKWKFIKVYYNAFIKGFVNIFAISYPFNNFFVSNLANELYLINYKIKILELTGWQELKTIGIEIQHNEKYNYQSSWHRDSPTFPSNSLNIIVYLKDEVGLRIVPNEQNHELKNIDISPSESSNKNGYVNMPLDYYDIINAKAGDILVMDSSLLHQGFIKGNRTHILIKCEEKNEKVTTANNFFDDYSISNDLSPNSNLKELEEITKTTGTYNFNINYHSLKNKFKSILYTFLYYVPLHRVLRYFLDFKKKNTYFHYTFFQ